MTLNMTAIRTDTNCAIPHIKPLDSGLWKFSATSIDNCSLEATVNPNNGSQPYGDVNVPNCVNATYPAGQPVRRSHICCGLYQDINFV
jgi:hypothetical protein